MNGYLWRIRFVDSGSSYLVDRTGTRTVGTTDPKRRVIFLSEDLYGQLLVKVLIHEIGHCAIVSFGLLGDIRKAVKPEYQLQAEEWICNFFTDYGIRIFSAAYEVAGEDVWTIIPYEIERIIK